MIFMLYDERNFADIYNNLLYKRKYFKRCKLKINIRLTYCRVDTLNDITGYISPQGLFILGDKNDFV
jgi:hypothetical protein